MRNQINQPFGEQVKRVRRSQGLSQIQLAKAANLSERHLRNFEAGHAISMEALARISLTLSITWHPLAVWGLKDHRL